MNSRLKHDSKPFWKFVNSHIKHSNNIPSSMFFGSESSTNHQESANLFSDYFSSVYSESCSSPNLVHSPPDLNHDSSHAVFVITPDMLNFAFAKCDNNVSSGPDNIPQFFIYKELCLVVFN